MYRAAFSAAALLLCCTAASAVLIAGPNGAADTAPFAEPALDHVGVRGCCTAIYVGNGIVLTANHVGAGDVSFGDTVYPYVPGTAVQLRNPDGTYADLMIFQIYPHPDLPALDIPITTPAFGSLLMTAGKGYDRGNAMIWDPNGTSSPGPTEGYVWGSGASVRWGNNNIEVYPAGGKIFNTYAFGSYFDSGRMLPESQAVLGDSGGAAFVFSPLGDWELAGVIIGIVQYSGQPANTTFFGQRTYYANLTYYRPQIEDATALPEANRTLVPGAAMLGWLAARRRRAVACGQVAAGGSQHSLR